MLFIIIESGKAINTTAEHPYFVKPYDKELCDKYAGNVWNTEYKSDNSFVSVSPTSPNGQEVGDTEADNNNNNNKHINADIYDNNNEYVIKGYDEIVINEDFQDKDVSNINNNLANNKEKSYCTRWVEVRDLSQSTTSNPSSSTMNSLPLNSLTESNNGIKPLINLSALGGCMVKTIMPWNWEGGNKTELRKSLSLVRSMLSSSSAKDASLPFFVPLSAYQVECPFDSKNFLSNFGIFSSSSNFVFDIMLSSDELGCPFQSICNHLFSQAGVIISNYLLGTNTSTNKFNYIANQDSSSLESGLSMADFTVSHNIFTNFNSHKKNDDNDIFKPYEIAVPDYSTGTIKWEKIISIKTLEPQHVYDLAIEDTRNFIANDLSFM